MHLKGDGIRICVIGGSGFIGTSFVKRLLVEKSVNFRILDKVLSKTFPQFVTLSDVRSLDQLRASVVEESVIVNLAAEHRDDVVPLNLYYDVNVGGARNICTVAREKRCDTIIFTSTVAVYGFAPIGTNEMGKIAPFNDYGQSKYEAENIFKSWQAEAPHKRTLVIIRPTVVFGERNRGNVYNLLSQIASGKFIMIGSGENQKSMAYVDNVAAFIRHSINFHPGIHTYNFVDKPDFTMNRLVAMVNRLLGRSDKVLIKVPFVIGYFIGKLFDLIAMISGKRFLISSIRIRKFCANSVYSTAIEETGFISPVPLEKALEKTVHYEFLESHKLDNFFYSE